MRLEKLRRVLERRVGIDRRAPAQRAPAHRFYLAPHLVGEAEEGALPQGGGEHVLAVDEDRLLPRARTQEVHDHLGLREDRQEGDDVSESLVKCRLVGGRGIHVPRAQRVDQRVRRFVHDDVVREAGVDGGARRAGEVAEHESLVLGRVERVGVVHPVGGHLELVRAERPADAPSQRELEARQRAHHECVRVLRMEAVVLDDGGVAAPPRLGFLLVASGELVLPVEVPSAGIVVHQLQPVAHRPHPQVFGGDGDARGDDLTLVPDRRILRDHRHEALRRCRVRARRRRERRLFPTSSGSVARRHGERLKAWRCAGEVMRFSLDHICGDRAARCKLTDAWPRSSAERVVVASRARHSLARCAERFDLV
jgi:hypothetical protein